MEQNPANSTQPNNTTPVADNQTTSDTVNPQSFQYQYQQPNPQQSTQQFTEQPVIINTCIHNKDNITQSFAFAKKRYIHIIIFASVGLVISMINCLFSDSVDWSTFMCAFFLWLDAFSFAFMKSLKKTAQAKESSDVFLYGSVCQPVTYFYNSYFTSYNPQSQARFFMSYQNIVAINEHKDIYVLILKENVVVLIQKNGFNLGNAEVFKAFIQSRAPITAKIKFK